MIGVREGQGLRTRECLVAEKGLEGAMQQPGANAQIQPLNMIPNLVIALILSNDRLSKMKNSLCSGLDLLKRPP